MSIFLIAVFDVSPGIQEVQLYLRLSHTLPRNKQHNTSADSPKNNNIIFLQEVHGKDGFMFLKCWARTNTRGSATCIHEDLLPDVTVVTHVIICQGRDHIVNVWSGRRNLVVRNVHFEPEIKLKNLLERPCLISPHWPQHPDTIGTMSDFNICNPRMKVQRSQTDFHRR